MIQLVGGVSTTQSANVLMGTTGSAVATLVLVDRSRRAISMGTAIQFLDTAPATTVILVPIVLRFALAAK